MRNRHSASGVSAPATWPPVPGWQLAHESTSPGCYPRKLHNVHTTPDCPRQSSTCCPSQLLPRSSAKEAPQSKALLDDEASGCSASRWKSSPPPAAKWASTPLISTWSVLGHCAEVRRKGWECVTGTSPGCWEVGSALLHTRQELLIMKRGLHAVLESTRRLMLCTLASSFTKRLHSGATKQLPCPLTC